MNTHQLLALLALQEMAYEHDKKIDLLLNVSQICPNYVPEDGGFSFKELISSEAKKKIKVLQCMEWVKNAK